MTAFRVVLLLLMLTTATNAGESTQVHNDFGKWVRAAQRQQFCAVLVSGVDAQKRRDWKTLYRLLRPEFRPSSELDFVKNMDGDRTVLLDFRVDQISAIVATDEHGMWDVLGCATLKRGRRTESFQAWSGVFFQGGAWNVDWVTPVLELNNPPTPPRACDPRRSFAISELCSSVPSK